MKRIALFFAAAFAGISALAQPQLREDNIEEVLQAMTVQEKVALLVGGPTFDVAGPAGATRAIERLGIPGTILADGPAGLRIDPLRKGTDKTFYCTSFPVGTLLASSWDTALAEEMTTAMGNEVLEYGVDVLLAPGLNLHRNPLCGRNFEYFSEDPLLSGKMAAAYVRGVQSNGVGTSIKHYAANNQETRRDYNDAQISERALRELYLRNFEIAVKEGKPWTVMSSYNRLNGEYTQQSNYLLTQVLRDDWGFDGIVMTDWGCKDGTVASAKAGNDLMEPGRQVEIDRILEAVNNGSISQEELDRNVRNMLKYIVKTPHFRGYKFSNAPDLAAHAKVARKAAEESIILLQNNNGALPLKGTEKVALYGVSSINFLSCGTGSGHVNMAYSVNMQDALSGAGFTLDEELTTYYKAYGQYLEAVRLINGKDYRDDWWNGRKWKDEELPVSAITRQAGNNDLAVIVLNRQAGEGSDRKLDPDFELTGVEQKLILDVSQAYHALGKKVVVILNVAGVVETASWKNKVDAIVLPWTPGQEGANAVTDILTGKVNPSGKLPMTFPLNYVDVPSATNFPDGLGAKGDKGKNIDYTKYEEDIFVGYRYYISAGVPVSYPFGYGLSYTEFSYSRPMVKVSGKGEVTATVTVTNTGSVAGKEVVELYISAPEGGLKKPQRELKAFAKTKALAPGESQTLTMKLTPYDLASYNQDASAWETAPGTYTALFGASSTDIKATAKFKLAK